QRFPEISQDSPGQFLFQYIGMEKYGQILADGIAVKFLEFIRQGGRPDQTPGFITGEVKTAQSGFSKITQDGLQSIDDMHQVGFDRRRIEVIDGETSG